MINHPYLCGILVLLTCGAETHSCPLEKKLATFFCIWGIHWNYCFVLFSLSVASEYIWHVCTHLRPRAFVSLFRMIDVGLWRAPLTHTFKARALYHLDSIWRQTSSHRSFLFDGNPCNHFYMVWEQTSEKLNFMYLWETFYDFPAISFPLTPWSWEDLLANSWEYRWGIFWECVSFDVWGTRRQTMGRTSKIEIFYPPAFSLATNKCPSGI